MIYELLYPLSTQFGWASVLNVLRYVPFRIIMATLTAMLLCFFLAPWFIRRLQSLVILPDLSVRVEDVLGGTLQRRGDVCFFHEAVVEDQAVEPVAEFGHFDAPVFIDQEGGRVQRLKPPHWRQAPPAAAFPLRLSGPMHSVGSRFDKCSCCRIRRCFEMKNRSSTAMHPALFLLHRQPPDQVQAIAPCPV